MTLEQTISAIQPLDEKSMTAARNRFANIAMPRIFSVSRCRIFPDARRLFSARTTA